MIIYFIKNKNVAMQVRLKTLSASQRSYIYFFVSGAIVVCSGTVGLAVFGVVLVSVLE